MCIRLWWPTITTITTCLLPNMRPFPPQPPTPIWGVNPRFRVFKVCHVVFHRCLFTEFLTLLCLSSAHCSYCNCKWHRADSITFLTGFSFSEPGADISTHSLTTSWDPIQYLTSCPLLLLVASSSLPTPHLRAENKVSPHNNFWGTLQHSECKWENDLWIVFLGDIE